MSLVVVQYKNAQPNSALLQTIISTYNTCSKAPEMTSLADLGVTQDEIISLAYGLMILPYFKKFSSIFHF